MILKYKYDLYLLGGMDSFVRQVILKKLKNFAYQNEKTRRKCNVSRERFENDGLKVNYPGLKSHRNHELMKSIVLPRIWFAGLIKL